MKNKYSKLTYRELRELLLKGELKHEYMSDYDYELLFDLVEDSDEWANIIIEFCIAGFIKSDYYKEILNIPVDISALVNRVERVKLLRQIEARRKLGGSSVLQNYDNLLYVDLRNLILAGVAKHELMSMYKYEYLLDNEAELEIPNHIVLGFCFSGLKKFDEYKDYENVTLYLEFVSRRKRHQSIVNKVFGRFYRMRGYTAGLASLLLTCLAIGSVVIAVSYGVVHFGKKIFDTPEKTVEEYNWINTDIVHTSDFRIYSSITEMLETENLNILYPAKLPDGYGFTNIGVANLETHLEIRAYAENPYIEFYVEVATSLIAPDSYSYETNDIKYNVVDMEDGLQQAYWFNGSDYYWIIVSDNAIIAEIINNLKEH